MRGSIAKENVTKIIKEAFGANFVGEESKKLYVWADDGGEKVQIAIALTCPKVEIQAAKPVEETPWEGFPPAKPKEEKMISPEEQETIEMLMEKLGIWD